MPCPYKGDLIDKFASVPLISKSRESLKLFSVKANISAGGRNDLLVLEDTTRLQFFQ